MQKVYQYFKYLGYIACSLFLGWLSNLGGNENDYILKVSTTIIPVLLTLVALTTTLTGLVINELYKFKSKYKKDITDVVDSLKRNVVIQVGIIAITFALLASKEAIIIYLPCVSQYIVIIQNSIVAFAFLYFILVIMDEAAALYDLIKKNNED